VANSKTDLHFLASETLSKNAKSIEWTIAAVRLDSWQKIGNPISITKIQYLRV
jgi:hypothetical protein